MTADKDRQGPVFGRDPLGRHKVELRNIRPAWVRYLLAASVVAAIVWIAVPGGEGPLTDEDMAPFVPWIGGVTLAVLGFALWAVRRGRQRRK
ncbi:hypothetical protein [Mangrovicoccus sp. HB161399]|uniref:hypothetical protein n=1 Tax=Mangrovicoccus sp. HB161399 TaxID=2720392 RepID=UPI001554E791|nr:hypothetical protein [Mangrovicoccus sp. HB161399]